MFINSKTTYWYYQITLENVCSFFSPFILSLLHFRSPTQNINWNTHGYFNLHKLVFVFTLLFFKLSSYKMVIMHLNSTCRLLIYVLHMNVSYFPYLIASWLLWGNQSILHKTPKYKWKKKLKSMFCCLFCSNAWLYTLKSIRDTF